MRLWLLERLSAECDEYKGFVIRATTVTDARYIADTKCIAARDRRGHFLKASLTTCRQIRTESNAGVVLEYYLRE